MGTSYSCPFSTIIMAPSVNWIDSGPSAPDTLIKMLPAPPLRSMTISARPSAPPSGRSSSVNFRSKARASQSLMCGISEVRFCFPCRPSRLASLPQVFLKSSFSMSCMSKSSSSSRASIRRSQMLFMPSLKPRRSSVSSVAKAVLSSFSASLIRRANSGSAEGWLTPGYICRRTRSRNRYPSSVSQVGGTLCTKD